MAATAMLPQFEFWEDSPLQLQVKRTFVREYTPITSLQHGSPITFNVPGADRLYMDLSRSYILVRAKITKPDGTAIAADIAGPVNLPLHSMFSRVEVELGGKSISDPNNLYPYRSYLETLLTYSPEVQKSQLKNEIWAKDTAGKMTVFTSAAAGENKGLVERAGYFDESAEVQMLGRIHDDIFHQSKAILGNISLRIRLIPSKDNFVIVTIAGTGGVPQLAYEFRITDIRFYVTTYELTPESVLSHITMLASKNLKMPIRRITMKHLSIPAGQLSAMFDNIYSGYLPERLVIGLVSDVAMSGGYQQNPFNFEHANLNYLSLYIDGEQVPNVAYQPNYAANQYLREYSTIQDGMGLMFTDKAVDIDRTEYPNGYTLYIFDLTPDQCAKNSISPQRQGSIRIDVRFSQALGATTNIVLYAEYESYIEIDKYLNIITPF